MTHSAWLLLTYLCMLTDVTTPLLIFEPWLICTVTCFDSSTMTRHSSIKATCIVDTNPSLTWVLQSYHVYFLLSLCITRTCACSQPRAHMPSLSLETRTTKDLWVVLAKDACRPVGTTCLDKHISSWVGPATTRLRKKNSNLNMFQLVNKPLMHWPRHSTGKSTIHLQGK